VLYLLKSDKVPFSIVIPNMDGTEKSITLMMNAAWNITQHTDFSSKCDVEIQAPNNKVLMTFHVIYPDSTYTKKLNRLLDLIKLTRNEILTGAQEKELKIYKIKKNTQVRGYYFIATADYQSNSKFNTDLHAWPILTSFLYLIDTSFVHVSIFSTSKQKSLFNEVTSMLSY
jgi:hypothetical protein